MALWPFRKRRKTKNNTEGKKPVVPDPPTVERKLSLIRKASLRQNPRRSASRRRAAAAITKEREVSYASSRAPVPDFPLPPNHSSSPTPMETEFQPQKQSHGGFTSYLIEMTRPASNSSASSHRHHKPAGIVRKLSKRGRGQKQEPPPSAYIQQLARTASKRDGKRMRTFDSFEYDRPMSQSSLPGRQSLSSSLSSVSSMRAYRIRSFELFTPRPRLRYDDGSGTTSQNSKRPDMTPSRTNSRTNPEWRNRNAGGEGPHHGGAGARVNDLADELDAKGLREAMDRDKKRREKKKLEDQERLQRKLEKKAMKDMEQEQMQLDVDMDVDQETDKRFQRSLDKNPGLFMSQPGNQMGESSRAAAAYGGFSPLHPYPFPEIDGHGRPTSMGTQTPLSWLNDPSTEDLSRDERYSGQRTDMVTPVSMNSVEDIQEEDLRDEDLRDEEPELYIAQEVHVTPHSHIPVSPIHSRSNSKSEKASHAQIDSPTIQHGGFAFARPMEIEEVEDEQESGRGKKSAWTSFIKRATAARIQKEQASREVQAGESALVSDSEEEGLDRAEEASKKDFYHDVEDFRHREGQTPGRHIPDELAFAMTALETGHVRGKDEIEDEQRDHFSPTPPLASYTHYGRPSSSRSSLGAAPHRPQGSSRGNHTSTPTSQTPESHEDSPTIPPQIPRTSSQQSHLRPSSLQRYSPSMHRYSSGQASPDNGPRSIMSTSLASIDSEGSWLSGKMTNPRHSVTQISPLRTSATSLRRRYKEIDDGASADCDDYFSGVESRRQRNRSIGEENNGETRMELSDVEDSDEGDDDASIDSETEQKMWRDGFGKKVVIQEVAASPRIGMLKDFDRENVNPNGEGVGSGARSTSSKEEFVTPLEHPYAKTAGSLEFLTPMEHPGTRQSTVAEIVGVGR